MEDILSQSQLLEWGGVSFNELEWYKIRTAAKKLLIENNCEFIRFFGKIFGRKSDYYIMQGLPKNYPIRLLYNARTSKELSNEKSSSSC